MGRLETVKAAVSGWDTDAAATVGTVCDGDKARGDGISGAARGAAGVIGLVVRVQGSAFLGVVVCGV